MTAGELLRGGKETLRRAGVPEWELDAWYLLEHVTGCTRNEYFLHPERKVSLEQEERYRELLRRRSLREPLQYLTGEQEFMGLSFRVCPDVLIPRQDTEILVEEVSKTLKPGDRILDLCTGSGCILISLLKLYGQRGGLTGVGADLSGAALETARGNARRLGVEAEFVQGDLFGPVVGAFDVIVSNPPYIPEAVVGTLQPEVKDHEPVCALDGGGDGLSFYRRIAVESPAFLRPGGRLYLEIGYDQAEAVSGLLAERFRDVRIVKDLAGLDRVVCGVMAED
ncbi:MAG: peptide chain release factor N(5)-glutamine methyltransferase [Eubacteriales bacterium]|nr:peptide chain release factor N(5)-glutamine methyltransferase [Eubacteriales bacterium]